MTAKFVSFVMVTLGLFLCTLDDGRLAAANAAAAAANAAAPTASSAAFSAVGPPATVPGFDSLADNGGAFTTLTGDDLRGREDLGRVGGGSASTYY